MTAAGRTNAPAGAPGPLATDRCHACGAPLATAVSRCPTCGEPVVRPERKIVTVLFADLTGYTALAESLDPEDVYSVVRPWMTELRLIVEDHGGSVPQVMGDGFMAVFGVPTAHEDDAERAVRAALTLVERAGQLDSEPSEVRFPGLHIGVNTGEVIVVGSREASGFAVVGDAVNVASRLADIAPAGRVIVGDATRALTRRAIRYGPRRLQAAKGKREPVATFEALAIRGSARAEERGPTARVPFVGRAGILRRLTTEIAGVQARGLAQVRVIVDEPGGGKTRLAEELRERLPGFLCLYGACHPYGQRLPLAPIAQAVLAALRIAPDATPAAARRRIREFVRQADDRTAAAVLEQQIGTILGLQGGSAADAVTDEGRPGGAALDAVASVRPVLRAVAGGRPTLVVLDDLHWGGPDLFQLLEEVHRMPWPEAVFLLALARPEPADWYRGLPTTRLRPIASRDARRIVKTMTGVAVPDAVVDRLVERAAGNPLFLEESGRMLLEAGLLVHTGDGWKIPDPAALDRVPSTLRLLVAARLDSLPPEAKRTLQDASVAGLTSWDGLLEQLAGLTEADAGLSLRIALGELEARDLLRRRSESRIPGAVELEFKHVVIRDVAYESLPRRERAQRHRQTADWLRGHADRSAVAAIAHHYEQAWELHRSAPRPSPDPALAALAAEYLRRYGDDVFALQPRLAEALYGRGLGIAQADPSAVESEEVAKLLIGRAEGLAELGRHREAIEAAEVGRSLVAGSAAPTTLGYALLALGRARSNLGEVRAARQLMEDALVRFEAHGDVIGQARGHHRLAETYRFDDFPAEIRDYRRAYVLYGRASSRVERALVAEDLAYLLTVVGGRAFQRWYGRASRPLADSGDERARAAMLRAWAYAAWYRGDLDEALRAAREARPAAAQAGVRWIEVDTLLIEALVRSTAGRPADAEQLVNQLIQIARSVGTRHLGALALLTGARPAIRLGRPLQATRRLGSARRTLAELGVAMEMAEVDLTEAAVLLDRGAWDLVEAPAGAGQSRALANGWRLLVPLGSLLRGRAHLGAGRLAAAGHELQRAASLARSLEAVGLLATAEAALEQVAEMVDADGGGGPPSEWTRRPERTELTYREARAIRSETEGLRALRRGDPDAAASFGRAVRLWHELGLTSWQARAEGFRAVALEAAGRRSAARASRRRAAAILAAIGSPWRPGPWRPADQ